MHINGPENFRVETQKMPTVGKDFKKQWDRLWLWASFSLPLRHAVVARAQVLRKEWSMDICVRAGGMDKG